MSYLQNLHVCVCGLTVMLRWISRSSQTWSLTCLVLSVCHRLIICLLIIIYKITGNLFCAVLFQEIGLELVADSYNSVDRLCIKG